MSSSSPKAAVFAGMADVAKGLGSAHRIEIAEVLGQGERSVEGIAGRVGLSVANTSQHLRLMRQYGLLNSRRDGKNVLYRLSDPAVVEILAALGRLAERQLAEVRGVVGGYFHDRDSMEPVSRDDLIGRVADGLVTVIDVRPEDEFRAGSLPSALNIPMNELAERLAELSPDREIVAYCRGPWCVMAFEAVALLRRHGLNARRLDGGFPEWKAAGLPVTERPLSAAQCLSWAQSS